MTFISMLASMNPFIITNPYKNNINILNKSKGRKITIEELKAKQPRNTPCKCNSGKKYKHCCGKS